MTARWMTDRQELAGKLRTINWNKMPRLGEGDAEVIAVTAGLGLLYDEAGALVIDVDSTISDVDDGRDSGASREEMESLREARDGAVEEFLSHVRAHLLPDVVAAEEAEAARIRREPLTGLGT